MIRFAALAPYKIPCLIARRFKPSLIMPTHSSLFALPKTGNGLFGLTNKESILVAGSLLVLYGCYRVWTSYNMRRKMPPGPMGLPFIGSKNLLPDVKPWWTFEKLNKLYGEHQSSPSLALDIYILVYALQALSCLSS